MNHFSYSPGWSGANENSSTGASENVGADTKTPADLLLYKVDSETRLGLKRVKWEMCH